MFYVTNRLSFNPSVQQSACGLRAPNRSSSVDRLYAVRREHIRFANGADDYYGATNISFTTDDIQDIYMPSAIDNYKRKIAVELERRRRHLPTPSADSLAEQAPVVLDDLDIFIIKRAKSTVETERLLNARARVKFPITHTDYKPVVVARSEPAFEEPPVRLERARVGRAQEEGGFAVVNRVMAERMDGEVVPSSSSESMESESMESLDGEGWQRLATVQVTQTVQVARAKVSGFVCW